MPKSPEQRGGLAPMDASVAEKEAKRVSRETVLDAGENLFYIDYQYDDQGRVTLEKQYEWEKYTPEGEEKQPEWQLSHTTTHSYNRESRIAKTRIVESEYGDETTIDYSYDDKGKLTRESEFTEWHASHSRYYSYDEKERLTKEEEVVTPQDSDDSYISHFAKYEYAADGSLKVTSKARGGEYQVTSFNVQGKKVKAEEFNSKDELMWSAHREYQEGGRLVIEKFMDGEEKILHTQEFRYDEQGRLVRNTKRYADGEIAEDYEYKREYIP